MDTNTSALESIYTEDDLISWIQEHLPCWGTVARVDGMFGKKYFYYVELGPEWQRSAGFLLGAMEKLFQYNEKVKGSAHKLNKALREKGIVAAGGCEFVAFPSNVGLHISIDSHAVGTRVEFELERCMTYENQNMGAVSAFDSSLYCALYLALRVKLKDPAIKLVSSTHISLASYAMKLEGMDLPSDGTSGKGGKGGNNNKRK